MVKIKRPKEKVYCANCIYNLDFFDKVMASVPPGYCTCRISINKYTSETKRIYYESNKNGKCPYYERKWWKYWIKKVEFEEVE